MMTPKYFQIIKSPSDAITLQSNLDKLVIWCHDSYIYFRMSISLILYFLLTQKILITSSYEVDNLILSKLTYIKDFDILLD